MFRKRYRPETKSSQNAANTADLDLLMGKIFLTTECADNLWFELSKAEISLQKDFIPVATDHTQSSSSAIALVPDQDVLARVHQYCFSERMVRELQSEYGVARWRFVHITCTSSLIMLLRRAIESHKWSQSQGNSGLIYLIWEECWAVSLIIQNFAIITSASTGIQNKKFWDGMNGPPITLRQSQKYTVCTNVKQKIPFSLTQERSIVCCRPSEKLWAIEKYVRRKDENWKHQIFLFANSSAADERMSMRWRSN
jgi:hypothetical protein